MRKHTCQPATCRHYSRGTMGSSIHFSFRFALSSHTTCGIHMYIIKNNLPLDAANKQPEKQQWLTCNTLSLHHSNFYGNLAAVGMLQELVSINLFEASTYSCSSWRLALPQRVALVQSQFLLKHTCYCACYRVNQWLVVKLSLPIKGTDAKIMCSHATKLQSTFVA